MSKRPGCSLYIFWCIMSWTVTPFHTYSPSRRLARPHPTRIRLSRINDRAAAVEKISLTADENYEHLLCGTWNVVNVAPCISLSTDKSTLSTAPQHYLRGDTYQHYFSQGGSGVCNATFNSQLAN